VERKPIANLLIHEVVAALVKFNKLDHLLRTDGMEPRTRDHLESVRTELGLDELLGIGIWLDGVPCNWDRSQSLEVITMNLPGLLGHGRNLRIPLAVLPKECVATKETFDDLMEIIVWSLKHLALGKHPVARHDGEPWRPDEGLRKARGGDDIGVRGALVEVRGDWLMMKEIFRLPGWKEKRGCCWACRATPDDIRCASAEAPWRQQRLSHSDVVLRMLEQGLTLSPLFGAPGVKASIFKIDWLHAMDQGVTPDYLGNLFLLLLKHMPGRRKKERVKQLHKKIKKFYKDKRVESRLETLTVGMIKAQGKAPKLRCGGAVARALVPFAKLAAQEHLRDANSEEATAKAMATHLDKLYATLSETTIYRTDFMKDNSRKFCILYSALEASFGGGSSKKWRIKPKFHLMQELCEETEGAAPSRSWCYRDEDFGGSAATGTRRRGGAKTVWATSFNYLSKFKAKHPIPRDL